MTPPETPSAPDHGQPEAGRFARRPGLRRQAHPSGLSPQGGAASGPAKPDPRRPLGEGAAAGALPGAPLLELADLRKRYNVGRPNEAEVLRGIDLRLEAGEFAALIGPSGSGKSTLLNIIGLLERPTAGSYRLQGAEVGGLDDAALTLRRRTTLGFVFQFHHLLPAFSALENVTLPALMQGGRVGAADRERALAMLRAVGLEAAAAKRPGELSGGMQQRVAIARALVAQPPLVLADEPTGNLDTASSGEVFRLMRQMHRTLGTAFLIVTHDPRLAARCDRVIELVDGRIASDRRQTAVDADNPPP